MYTYIYIYIIYILYIYYLYVYKTYIYNKALNLKAYIKIRRAADTISHIIHILKEEAFLMLLGGQSSPTSLVVSQLAQMCTPRQLIWITWSGLDFGLALLRGCQRLAAQLQIVPPYWSLFLSKHIRAWSDSMFHQHRLKLQDYYALHSYWNQ